MKVVFLDIDGVLVTEKTWEQAIGDFAAFDPDCVARLNDLVKRGRAKVVISSTWRLTTSLEKLTRFFREQGVEADLIDVTPDREDMNRTLEVQEWLDQSDSTASFVVIDDGQIDGQLAARHVRTQFALGLQPEHVDRALQLLEG